MSDELAETKIERLRYFFEFETLMALKVTHEITFSNESKSPISTIKFDLGEYKPYLRIFDTNNEILEFSKSREAGSGDFSQYLIDIKLPHDRELKPNERRTLIIKYVSPSGYNDDAPQFENAPYSRLVFDLKEEINLYIAIKSSDNFQFVDYPYILDNDGNPIRGEVEKLSKKDKFMQDESGQNSYFSIKSESNDKTLVIYHRQAINQSISNWIVAGKWLGIISAIVISLFIVSMLLSKNNLIESNFLISYPVFVMTSLVVIKGWLFSKDLDSKLERYDKQYLILIGTLFAELLLILLFQLSSPQNPTIQACNITECNQVLNFTFDDIPTKCSTMISNNYNSTITINT